MTVQPADVYERLKQLRRDATAIQAGITDVTNMLRELNLADTPVAPCRCGLELGGPLQLAEHIYTSHDGPLPDHWAALDDRIVEPVRRPAAVDVSPFPHDEPFRSKRRQVAHCRSCRAPIVWSTTQNGKKMPMDAVPVDDGRWRFVDGVVRQIVTGGENMSDDEARYSAHWETCPDAKDWRRPHEVAK